MKTNNQNQKQNGSELKSRPEQSSKIGEGKGSKRVFVDFKQRAANQQLPTVKVLESLLHILPEHANRAEVVGSWVWIQFGEIPAEEIRRNLSELGFHWNRKRSLWQHPCGAVRARKDFDPRKKYGSRSLAQAQAA